MEDKEIKLAKVLQDMSFSLKHIEDIMADDRALLVKLVKQNNSIVDWLKQIEIDEIITDNDIVEEFDKPFLSSDEEQGNVKYKQFKELLETFMDKQKELKEFEKELKKHKDKLTPGQVGES